MMVWLSSHITMSSIKTKKKKWWQNEEQREAESPDNCFNEKKMDNTSKIFPRNFKQMDEKEKAEQILPWSGELIGTQKFMILLNIAICTISFHVD